MSAGSRKKRQSVSQTVGGVLFGFEQQVLRNQPPPEELVHDARPDLPVASADGELLTLELPDVALEPDDPWAGYEDLLESEDEDDPWADLAAELEARSPATAGPGADEQEADEGEADEGEADERGARGDATGTS
jgi:hypothetical protein